MNISSTRAWRDTLGEQIARVFSDYKRHEWKDFCSRVHQWELDAYLAKY